MESAEIVSEASDQPGIFRGHWEERLAEIVATMREISLQTDPQGMVRVYRERMKRVLHVDRILALSRRGLEEPRVRLTRSSTWEHEIDPWKEPERLPVLNGGLLASLIYGDEPRLFDDFEIDPDDPAAPYLQGMRSLMATPHYDRGEGMNMVVMLRKEPGAFLREEFPEWVWLSNLFGRATHSLVLNDQVRQAYSVVERELKIVADLQRTLLPKKLPKIPTLDLAAHYQTSTWAGGDYYDIFALPDDRWGLLIADVSGHGTPAAVMMAVTHSIAHTYPGPPERPADLLNFLNHHLASRYTVDFEAFVTAFYGIYDPSTRALTYASAGHNPPRLKRCEDGTVLSLDGVGNLPLGISSEMTYDQTTQLLRPGDQIVFYTDGITEATSPEGSLFGLERLDEVLHDCQLTADSMIRAVLDAVERFTEGSPPTDDRTMLVAKVS